jgi:CDP-diacylglycerol---serine O-phosphatidyltransferase
MSEQERSEFRAESSERDGSASAVNPEPSAGDASDDTRRLRLRRRGRSVAIRSFHFLPSLATLGNAICGFGAIYVASFYPSPGIEHDPWAIALGKQQYVTAVYLIFLAMLFDAIDGRLARFTRHTTDFGGQLDSLADVISFGVAPAYLALQVLKFDFGGWHPPFAVSRLIWAIGALYMSCAALRLARFNTANEHGEQHHMSFQGLPSPGAGGAVAAFILMQQELRHEGFDSLANLCLYALPLVVLGMGLLMVSNIRYPHFVNRYLRGRKSLARIVIGVALVLLLVVYHQYVIATATLAYALSGPLYHLYLTTRARRDAPPSEGV